MNTDDVGEINGLANKGTPVAADELIIEDSAASWGKKKISWSQLPGGASGTNVQVDTGGNLTDADFQDGGDINFSEAAGVVTAAIKADTVTYDKMQDTTDTNLFLGRDTAGGGTVEEIAKTEALAILNVEDGADVTSTNETTHADVVQDGDFSSAGYCKTDGAGAYSVQSSPIPVTETDAKCTDALADQTSANETSHATVVTATAVIGDNRIIRGDGGIRLVQAALPEINDAGTLVMSSGVGIQAAFGLDESTYPRYFANLRKNFTGALVSDYAAVYVLAKDISTTVGGGHTMYGKQLIAEWASATNGAQVDDLIGAQFISDINVNATGTGQTVGSNVSGQFTCRNVNTIARTIVTPAGGRFLFIYTGQNQTVTGNAASALIVTPSALGSGTTLAKYGGVFVEDQRAIGTLSQGFWLAAQSLVSSAITGNYYAEGGNWNTGHWQLGNAHIWFDGTTLYGKISAPTGATDGTDLLGGGSGETNTASNQGTDGVGVYDTKVVADLQFRHVAPGSTKITTTLNGKDIDIDVVEANLVHDHDGVTGGGTVDHVDLANKGTNTHGDIDNHITGTTEHSATGAIMGTTNTQTVTNKDLTAETNKLRSSKSFSFEIPEDGERFPIYMNERAITILGVSFSSEGGTSVLFNLEFGTTIASGTVIHTDTCATSTPEWDVTPSGDSTVPTDQIIMLEITTVTATVNVMHVTFYYTED